jgi:hypothetical protein
MRSATLCLYLQTLSDHKVVKWHKYVVLQLKGGADLSTYGKGYSWVQWYGPSYVLCAGECILIGNMMRDSANWYEYQFLYLI